MQTHAAPKASLVRHYPESTIREFASALARGLGASEQEAAIISDGITTASLWWHPGQGQGLEKFFRYHRRVKSGGIVPRANMVWVKEGSAVALLEAAKAFGYVAAHTAMKKAIELARRSGVAMVGVRNSNHFGIAGYHAKTAADAGCIGLAMTNAGAEMAPWGAKTAVLGTNPWGIAVPRGDAYPIVLDMALTMSGRGMIAWALKEGRQVADDLALTPDGRRSTNPAELIDGTQLPIGRFKGAGLSFVTDVLTGVLTGAKFGKTVFQDETHFDVGHTLIAIDVEAFVPRARFHERLEQLISEVKSAAPISPGDEILLPGEAEFLRMQERREKGIPVSVETVERLRKIAEELRLSCPL